MIRNSEINERKLVLLILQLLLLFLLLPVILTGCGAGKAKGSSMDKITSYKQLNKAEYRLGVVNGNIAGPLVEKQLPKAKRMYFNTEVDMYAALENGKVDAIVNDNFLFIYHNECVKKELRLLDGYLTPFHLAYAFNKSEKGKKLNRQLSDYIEKLQKDGSLKKIQDAWLKGKGKMAVDYSSLPAPNGVLTMATTGSSPPFSFVQNDTVVGMDIDVAARFCKEYGYGLKTVTMSFDGLVTAVASGKCDFAGSNIGVTKERKESVDFSSVYLSGGTAAAVYDYKAANGNFFKRLKSSFYKTFVRDNRYRLFLHGILTTILITILSALFGTILGFVVFMFCRKGNKIANMITRFCIWIIQGMPVVVLLMILYYIVFSSAPVSGAFVSVVAFSLTFGAAVFGMVRTSVDTVSKGQLEAAYALGFSDIRTFFKIVMPQALVHFLPPYKAELVTLIKATAVVGYIAVQDLTRTGDIIRSQTYEAFFPLIAVAVIYFILAGVMIFIVNRLQLKADTKRRNRSEILKGVKTDD